VLHRLGFSRFKPAHARHINILCFHKTARCITIDGFFTDVELVGIVHGDMAGLPAPDERADKLIQSEQFIFCDVDAMRDSTSISLYASCAAL
jgi:hypothetical protein